MASSSQQPVARNESASRRERPGGSALGVFRNTWKAMNEWGDRVEAKHFNGDFLGTIAKVPFKTADALNTIGDGGCVQGDFVASMDRTIYEILDPVVPVVGADCEPITLGPAVASPDLATFSSSSSSSAPLRSIAEPPSPRLLADPPIVFDAATQASWVEAQSLRSELQHERSLRRLREARRHLLDVALPPLREDLAKAILDRAEADSRRIVAEAVSEEAERPLDELRVRHHLTLSQQATQEAELQRHKLAKLAFEKAARKWAEDEGGGGSREWARDGPETDALRNAKLALAEVLMEVDEVRLMCRKDLKKLQDAVVEQEGANSKLRQDDNYIPPQSLLASVRLLFNVARGRVAE